MKEDRRKLESSFPSYLGIDVQTAINKIPNTTKLTYSPHFFHVKMNGETLYIPERIYYAEPNMEELSITQQKILSTLFTRHHDGFVRENMVKEIIISSNEDIWITPYLVKLVGEYVIEILQAIKENLHLIDIDKIKAFLSQNEKFYNTIESRVMSYWNCYYRRKFPQREDYVGFQLLNDFKS